MTSSADDLSGIIAIGLVLLGIILIDLALFVAWAIRKDAADAGFRPPLFAPRWSLVDVWFGAQIVVVMLVVAMIPLGLIAILIWGPGSLLRAEDALKGPAFLFLLGTGTIVQNIVLGLVPAGFIRWKYGQTLSSIGMSLLPRREDVKRGILHGLALFVLAGVVSFTLEMTVRTIWGAEILSHLKELNAKLTMESMLTDGISPGLYVVLMLMAAVAAPIGEELFFRGFVYNAARRRLGVPGGVLLSALLFAAPHLGPLAVPGIVLIGVYLAAMYERTRSLWVPILMHAMNNGLAITALFLGLGK